MSRPAVIMSLAVAGLSAVFPAARAQEDTVGRAPAVEEVLRLHSRINEAALTGNVAVFEERLSEDFVASDPGNNIRRRDDMIAVFANLEIVYDSVEATVDFAEQLGEDLVVIMGIESTTQSAVPADSRLGDVATRTLHRRYTNVFRKEQGVWRLLVKQSTIVPDP